MSEREQMLAKWKSGVFTVTELAREFGVSRPTAYLWIERGEVLGELHDRRSTPHSSPTRTVAAVVQRIVETKRRWPQFGAKKVIQRLTMDEPHMTWPSASTAGRILEQHELVKKRRERRPASTILHARKTLGATVSGEMMTVDHKGHFRTADGKYCYPLTMNDPVSRYVYTVAALASTAMDLAKRAMEAVFIEYGVPRYIGSDNGGPFCCTRALAGLTRLSVWWIRQGITPVRIHPGCPWENGIHERMHRTLKAYTARPAATTMRKQQLRFDAFLTEFNTERPHDALGGDVPINRLKSCTRAYRSKLDPLEYPRTCEIRRVLHTGEIKWQGQRLFASETLAGELVAFDEIDNGVWSLRFAHIELARYDERTKRLS